MSVWRTDNICQFLTRLSYKETSETISCISFPLPAICLPSLKQAPWMQILLVFGKIWKRLLQLSVQKLLLPAQESNSVVSRIQREPSVLQKTDASNVRKNTE
ncbi:unnamed protein product [Rangifer tarandus platyrhynchus]|uniref:Uncharacterized protein n=1 Tax=Rangifer tarandus platyrhynchus TaxID=3082113 RepID=A0AC59Y243_RANTA